MRKIKVFDFDGTLYKGDSSVDFFLFALKKHKKLVRKIPGILWYGLLYGLHIVKMEKFKGYFFSFLAQILDTKSLVKEFWKRNSDKLNGELMEKLKNGEVCVISASPEFLVAPSLANNKNVKVIATKIDIKTGEIRGDNCRGDEKIKRFQAVFRKDYIISEFYSDSEKDQPLADMAEKAYIVDNGKILDWSKEYLWKKKIKKVSWGLFAIFLLVYLVGGVLLSYNHNFKENLDLLFSSDSARVIDDYSQILAGHYRITVHPLFVLLFQPIILLLKGITMNEILAIVLFSAIVGALAVMLMYRFVALFQRSTKTCTILSLIYGFSFGALVFNCSIEVYGVAALSLLFLWYQVAKVLKEKWGQNTTMWLYVAAILTISITITNYAVFLIACLVLLLSKKASFKKLLLINIAAIMTVLGLSIYQQAVWHSPALVTDVVTHTEEKETKFIKLDAPLTMVKNVVRDDFYNSLISSPLGTVKIEHEMMVFNQVSIVSKILTTVMYLILIIFMFWHRKKDRLINCGLILTLICFSSLHLIYGNEYPFLYALHFLYLIVGLIGINFVDEKKKSYRWFLGFFVIYFIVMVLMNLINFRKLIGMVAARITPNIFASEMNLFGQIALTVGIIVLMAIFVGVIIWNVMRIMKERKGGAIASKRIMTIIGSIFAILTMFIAIEATDHYQQFFWIDFRPIEFSASEKAETMTKGETFESYKVNAAIYQQEYEKYREDLQKESSEELPNATICTFDKDGQNIMYVNGELVYGDTGKLIDRLDVIDQVIVPSEKLVIVNTWNEKYIAIQEEDDGVHVYMDGMDGRIK